MARDRPLVTLQLKGYMSHADTAQTINPTAPEHPAQISLSTSASEI
jgi:hypothetical protein